MKLEALTEQIIGAAIEVHRHLGPGLLGSACEECLCHELSLSGLAFEKQLQLPVLYKGAGLDCGHRIDPVIEREVVLELKSAEKLQPIHEAQLLTWMRLGGYKVCLRPRGRRGSQKASRENNGQTRRKPRDIQQAACDMILCVRSGEPRQC